MEFTSSNTEKIVPIKDELKPDYSRLSPISEFYDPRARERLAKNKEICSVRLGYLPTADTRGIALLLFLRSGKLEKEDSC